MLHRKKDLILLLIEQWGKYIAALFAKDKSSPEYFGKKLDEAYSFYKENFNVMPEDSSQQIFEKLPALYFIEEYAKLLVIDYKRSGEKSKVKLQKSLDLLDYLERVDTTYSWERFNLKIEVSDLLENDL